MNDPKDEEISIDNSAGDADGVALGNASEVREADPMAQVELAVFFTSLIENVNRVLMCAEEECAENESLASEPVDWENVNCDLAEVWRDSNGDAGYRVYLTGSRRDAHKFHAWVSDKLAAMGIADIAVRAE